MYVTKSIGLVALCAAASVTAVASASFDDEPVALSKRDIAQLVARALWTRDFSSITTTNSASPWAGLFGGSSQSTTINQNGKGISSSSNTEVSQSNINGKSELIVNGKKIKHPGKNAKIKTVNGKTTVNGKPLAARDAEPEADREAEAEAQEEVEAEAEAEADSEAEWDEDWFDLYARDAEPEWDDDDFDLWVREELDFDE